MFVVLPIRAFEFVKSSSNPLNVHFINDYTSSLQAHIYKEDGVCKGILTAKRSNETYYSLVAIESSNCLDWNMTREIFNTGQELSNARLFIDSDGTKKLFFTKTEAPDFYRIYSTDCDRDLNCSTNFSLILDPNKQDLTEKNGHFAAHVLKTDKYYLFYGVWGIDGFKIKLAYSDDLSSWQKCPNSLTSLGRDGPFPLIKDNTLYLFYHRSDGSGIGLSKTDMPLNCDSSFEDQGYQITPSQWYDQGHLFFPSVIQEATSLSLYYSGRGNDNVSRLNLANYLLPVPTVTLIPTPTLTIAPSPTLIPTKKPIIIIPGFMASWNKEAILHNQVVDWKEWKMNPIVKEYQGLINTLKNIGYVENKDFFVFNYDWRKSITEISDDLRNYLSDKPSFQIVGHSLGGLIARVYQEKNQDERLIKLITVGSPHQGVAQVYKPVEAGEIERWNNFLWLAEKTILMLNKNGLETDRQTVNRIMPVLQDIFPVFNFLKKNQTDINVANMKVKNQLLINESNIPNVFSLAGEKGPTLKGYIIGNQSFLDTLLNLYPDGRPMSTLNDIGDYLVLSSSARFGTSFVLNLDHSEIIYAKEAIKKILDGLNVDYNDQQIVEGQATKIDQSIIFLIKSPAEMEVIFTGKIYPEQDGMIFIENANEGDYHLKVKGKESGNYEVLVGQIGKKSDVWNSITGKTVVNQTDAYSFHYNEVSPGNIPYSDLLTYLKINNYAFKNLRNINEIYKRLILKKDFIGIEKLENHLFISSNIKKQKRTEITNKEVKEIEKQIKRFKKPVDVLILNQIFKRLEILKNPDIDDRYSRILLETVKKLLQNRK